MTARSRQVWTPQVVAARLAEAAEVLHGLPRHAGRGLCSSWPLDGSSGSSPSRPSARRAAPPPEAIDRMDEVLAWLVWVEPEERRLVWLRAEGLPWKLITHRIGVGRTTAWQRWTAALLKIATRLNAKDEQICSNNKPLNRSGRFVLQSR